MENYVINILRQSDKKRYRTLSMCHNTQAFDRVVIKSQLKFKKRYLITETKLDEASLVPTAKPKRIRQQTWRACLAFVLMILFTKGM